MKLRKPIGIVLIVSGVLVVIFSHQIVFPGLEKIVGIETIVGKENVSYGPDGSYWYTNPGAMMKWVASVAAIGILIAFSGILVLIRAKQR